MLSPLFVIYPYGCVSELFYAVAADAAVETRTINKIRAVDAKATECTLFLVFIILLLYFSRFSIFCLMWVL